MCVSCPAMHHCSVNQPLLIGPNGFPLPGQLGTWGNNSYPDQSGAMAGSAESSQMPAPTPADQSQVPPTADQSQGPSTTDQSQMPPNTGDQSQTPTQPEQPQPTTVNQPQTQPQTPPSTADQSGSSSEEMPTQVFGQPTQVFGQPSTTAQQAPSTTAQPPISLYHNNVLSASDCTKKTDPCSCHYASCTQTGDCICGWDSDKKTCRAGIATKCESCPAMHRCGVAEPLEIGPNGFPVPGQLSVWGSVPYPDQTGGGKGKGKAGKAKGKNAGKAVKVSNQTAHS